MMMNKQMHSLVSLGATLFVLTALAWPSRLNAERAPERIVRTDFDEAHGPSASAKPLEDALDIEVLAYEGDRAVLKVRNRTPFLVVLYIKGVRVGWLKPYKTGVMRGLRAGYHRVYAHSRWGSSYWGPRRVWVPGHWNLYR
jgi:hypothetical protein